jgi:hypothetical protein
VKEVPCDNGVEAVSTKEIGQVAHHGSREHFGDAVAAHCQPILGGGCSAQEPAKCTFSYRICQSWGFFLKKRVRTNRYAGRHPRRRKLCIGGLVLRSAERTRKEGESGIEERKRQRV